MIRRYFVHTILLLSSMNKPNFVCFNFIISDWVNAGWIPSLRENVLRINIVTAMSDEQIHCHSK